ATGYDDLAITLDCDRVNVSGNGRMKVIVEHTMGIQPGKPIVRFAANDREVSAQENFPVGLKGNGAGRPVGSGAGVDARVERDVVVPDPVPSGHAIRRHKDFSIALQDNGGRTSPI